MATDTTQGLQARGNRDIATTTEGTRPGVLLTPPVDIFEEPNAITVVADMPGVKPEWLQIGLHEGVLTITGHAKSTDEVNEVGILQEYRTGTYQRSFSLSEAIDQSKIQAMLKHGVLRLRLPKAEQAKPRQITIETD
jgi:HSP20 family protein